MFKNVFVYLSFAISPDNTQKIKKYKKIKLSSKNTVIKYQYKNTLINVQN